MLHAGGDEVALFGLGLQGGPDGGVVAFGAAGREDDLVGMAPSRAAMRSRASSTARPTWPPKVCMLDGLPYRSVR